MFPEPAVRDKHPLLVVEGVDLVGKTTLAKKLTEVGFQYLYCPQLPLSAVRKAVEDLNDVASRFFYYLATVVSLQPMLREMLSQGPVVIDRYIDSTLIMHRALGVNVACVHKEGLPIIAPDHTLVLAANREVRKARRSIRGDLGASDFRIEQSYEVTDQAQKLFLALGHPVIDTSTLTLGEVFDHATRLIRRRFP